ncbi:hypothetical protein LZ31DRAFT_561563 [Colletotrichum somersetense]|nr:hypothetical protein LZ31DRAFT_561563 [Colletotrichum somersetense]
MRLDVLTSGFDSSNQFKPFKFDKWMYAILVSYNETVWSISKDPACLFQEEATYAVLAKIG